MTDDFTPMPQSIRPLTPEEQARMADEYQQEQIDSARSEMAQEQAMREHSK